MLTIFAVPKPFQGEFNIIQRNAIQSWLQLNPGGEIILFGNEKGTSQIAREFGIKHIPEVKKNEFGTPLVNHVFEMAQKLAKNNILVYINTDIVLTSSIQKVVSQVNFSKFLMIGRRWNLDIKKEIDFMEGWQKKLREKVRKKGKLAGPSAIDYFVFSKGTWENIPSFALGRRSWDNWLLFKAWLSKTPIIDVTEMIMAIHQNHPYSHPKGKTSIWKSEEAKRNLKLAGGARHLLTIRDSNFILTHSGLKKSKISLYRILSFSFRYFEKVNFFLKVLLFPGWLGMILQRKLKYLLS